MLRLERFNWSPNETLSRLIVGRERLWAVETGWKGNAPFMSCVPLGRYDLVPYRSPSFGIDTWALRNHDLHVYVTEEEIPTYLRGIARARCIFHAANLGSELKGCVAPGWRVGTLSLNGTDYHSGVMESKRALDRVFDLVDRTKPQRLEIVRFTGSWS